MSSFTQAEIDYLQGQQLGRLATVNESGEPHVLPTSFRYNAKLDTIDIGGHNLAKSKKFRDVTTNGRAAFVVDDVLPPWHARGIEIRRRAEVLGSGGQDVIPDGSAELIRVFPRRIVAWGIDTHPYQPAARSVE